MKKPFLSNGRSGGIWGVVTFYVGGLAAWFRGLIACCHLCKLNTVKPRAYLIHCAGHSNFLMVLSFLLFFFLSKQKMKGTPPCVACGYITCSQQLSFFQYLLNNNGHSLPFIVDAMFLFNVFCNRIVVQKHIIFNVKESKKKKEKNANYRCIHISHQLFPCDINIHINVVIVKQENNFASTHSLALYIYTKHLLLRR